MSFIKKHFPICRQHDAMQCGVACLQMVCEHYGQEWTLEELSRYCFATSEGVSLLGISEAAEKLGFHTVAGRVTVDMLATATLPCILHWNQNHFVVLYGVKRNKKYYIVLPERVSAIGLI